MTPDLTPGMLTRFPDITCMAIDPGTTHSAVIYLKNGTEILGSLFLPNDLILDYVRAHGQENTYAAIEMIACYGLPVGAEVFETCLFIGRLQEAFWRLDVPVRLIFRKDIKLHLCHTARAKDANVRQALIDRFGGKERAIGKVNSKGPLHGISKHGWAALALAIYAHDNPQI